MLLPSRFSFEFVTEKADLSTRFAPLGLYLPLGATRVADTLAVSGSGGTMAAAARSSNASVIKAA